MKPNRVIIEEEERFPIGDLSGTGLYRGGRSSSPLLYDEEPAWTQLKQVCAVVGDHGGTISTRCGGHVHIGTTGYGNDPPTCVWQVSLPSIRMCCFALPPDPVILATEELAIALP